MKRQRKYSNPKPPPQKPKKQKTNLLYQTPSMKTIEKKDHAISLQLNTNLTDTWGTSPGWALLNGVGQGVGSNDRIGRKIKMVSFTLHWNAFVAPTSTQGGQIRVKVIYDRSPNSATPLTTDILDADTFYGHNNLSNSERFVTLLDFITPPIRASENFSIAGKNHVKIGLDAQYGGAGFGITSINTGGIFINACQSGNILTASPAIKLRSRIRYLDS